MSKVSISNLGCPKNLVDSQNLLKRLQEIGLNYTSNPEESDFIVVNTCGFIDAAKKESVEEIVRLAQLKTGKRRPKLIVFGCLAQRYGDELLKEVPEIDVLRGVGAEDAIVEYCGKTKEVMHEKNLDELFWEKSYSYLKIADGCSRKCSYCVIPQIRGKFISRIPDDILDEAKKMISSGIKELIVIAQDITSYGRDLTGFDLSRLLNELCSIHGDFWIRLLYLYPSGISDDLLKTIASQEKICNYIDMPLQHSEKNILNLMGRGGSSDNYRRLIAKIRKTIPEVNIRTTFIVGYPQETERDFDRLVEFVNEMEFERLGVFTYSREEKTPAFSLRGQIPKRIKRKRFDTLMRIQSAISLSKNRELVGRTFRTLIDEVDNEVAIARIYSQAPEIDGVVFVHDCQEKKGTFVDVKIDSAYDYDLKGKVV